MVDYTAGHIVKVSPDGLTKTTFATIPSPVSITRDAAGNLYVAEYFDQKIDKITPAGVVSTYVAAIGGANDRLTMLSMDTDNTSMPSCLGFEKDTYGYWYSVSYDGDQVFRIRASDGVGAAVAGVNAGAGHVDGTLAASRFSYPCRPVLRDNILYIPEYNNDDVRVIYLEPASPTKSPSWGAIQALYR